MATRKSSISAAEATAATRNTEALLRQSAEGAVDSLSAEAFIAERHIGERIKRLRLKRSMGLVELGKQAGLSASFLSQLETGRVVPTLRNLARIAMVFGKDLSYFFDPEPHTLFRVYRKGERLRMPQTGVASPSYYFQSLACMVPDRSLDPYYAEFVPVTGASEMRPHVHPGYEFLYVLEGALEIHHGDKTHRVESGDAVYFDAGTPHSYHCAGNAIAVALIVTMHQPTTAQMPLHLHTLDAPLPTHPVPEDAHRVGLTAVPSPASEVLRMHRA